MGAEFLIYMNNTLIYSVPYEQYYGDQIGHFKGKRRVLRAYNLTLYYLEK